ncbi:VWA domain-containing protein [Jejudonia soesokkakensis]|uniref:VWA domain-containing protein n=1 Tax=Jejudonia soesokkakensis TaxID=1323432 RepID=A0ABW2MRW9_9FLAO
MKTVSTYVITLFLIGQCLAQNPSTADIETVMLSTRDLITHAADQYPSEQSQQLLLLINTNDSKFNSNERFYIQQGIKLLLKRSLPSDKLAIGTYGTSNKIILPFTEVSNTLFIETAIHKLLSENIKSNDEDGIDKAYQLMLTSISPENHNKVIMLRSDTNNLSSVAANQSSNSAVSKNENNENDSKEQQVKSTDDKKIGGAIILTALSLLPEILEVIKD